MPGPFVPVDEREYAVTYVEKGQERTLIGTITFPEAGGVLVVRTRAKQPATIHLAAWTKIEEISEP